MSRMAGTSEAWDAPLDQEPVQSARKRMAADLERLLEAFPAFFHEPFYSSYAQTDLEALFAGAGLVKIDADQAFLTKAILFRKPAP